jgi:hypothetical protein
VLKCSCVLGEALRSKVEMWERFALHMHACLQVNQVSAGEDSCMTVTPVLIRTTSPISQPLPLGADSTGSWAAAADAADADAAATEDGDAPAWEQPAAKKPRRKAPAPGAAAAAAGVSSGARGRGRVHSSDVVQAVVACYVCQLADIPSRFDPAKAAELGVPCGPVRWQLGACTCQ